MTLEFAKLGALADLKSGYAFKSEDINSEGRGIPLVRIGDVMPAKTQTFVDRQFDENFAVNSGDILIGMSGDFNCARWAGGRALLNQRVCRIQINPGLLNDTYVLHFLPAALKEIERRTPSAILKNMSMIDLKSIMIPLPPVDEQRRIAAILEQADNLRRKRRLALEKLNALPQAIFHEMFGDPVANSNQWETAYLGALCRLVRGSSPRPQGDARFFGGPIPRLMIADLTRDGMIVFPKIDSLTLEGARRSRPMPAGTVVMAVSGAVGLPAILGIDACIHDGFVGFPDLTERISPLYLYYWLLSQRALNSSRAPGAIWINLTTDQVGKFLIALPPRDVQEAFAMRVNSLSPILEKVSLNAKGLDELFNSLQHNAFAGTLIPSTAAAMLASLQRDTTALAV